MLLEYVPGGSITYFINGQPLSEEIARYYFSQLIDVLHYCHEKGIVHRDLKPENIMLDAELNIKLADFGHSAPLQGRNQDGLLKTEVGTKGYKPPEMDEKKGKLYMGHLADFFSLGVVLFNMVTGRSPFANAKANDK